MGAFWTYVTFSAFGLINNTLRYPTNVLSPNLYRFSAGPWTLLQVVGESDCTRVARHIPSPSPTIS